ncbi:MAG TPA: alpha/beta hydrolase family protein [Hyphomicrobiales bacterium]|nr:alpha/beta hydrolase family protein [Hyphomicrobiales bacterium]
MTTFVLVQGAFEGGWYWKPVATLLERQGHTVFRQSLTGLGERSHLLSRSIDLETHIADVTSLIRYERLDGVTLVGHSYGGMVVTGVADRMAERIGALIYLDAALPESGQSMFDLILPARREAMLAAAAAAGEGWTVPCPPVTSWGIEDAEQAAEMEALVGPHPLACFTQKLALAGNHLSIRRMAYVLASRYRPSPFERIAAWARATPGWESHELPTHHFPMLSMPAEVCGILVGPGSSPAP